MDASALLEVVLQSSVGREIEALIFAPGESLHAPYLVELEVAQVLRRYVRTSVISAERAAAALRDLIDFPLDRYPHTFLLDRIWELRQDLTVYDAAYLALAEFLGGLLITRDRALAGVASPARVKLF